MQRVGWLAASRDAAMPHIEIRNVSLVYDTPGGSVTGLGGVSFDIAASEFLCPARPLRLRQDDAAQHHRRVSQAHRR
jgi:hypothetical protein